MYANLLHESREVSGPSHGDGGGAEEILEDQVPADDPGNKFTERRIAVRIGAPGDRDHAREFGVAQAREKASESGYNEGEDDCRSGVRRGRPSRQHENSGADDRADAQRGEVQRAERAPQRVFGGFARCLSLQNSDALLRP